MSGIIDIGKSALGIETSGEKAARRAAGVQAGAAEAGAEEQRRQFDITTGQLSEAQETSRRALLRGQAQQFRQLDPFAQAGRGALEQQQALLGLGTPEQQASAQASLTESPGQKFIRERAERSLVRNAAAIGGLGGGNVRTALVQQGAGFAAGIEGDQFRRLQGLTSAGQAAATNIGQGALGTASGIGSGALSSAARQGQFGAQAAGQIAQLQGAAGQARASGILGAQQAKTGAFGNLLSLGTGLASGGFLGEKAKQFVGGFQ